MKVVYIAGPFTASTPWEIECNVRRAEEVALEVARAGAMPLCPHANTRYFHGECTEWFWYVGTMELLLRCDAVLLVEGWERSKGACAERDEAIRRGKPVFRTATEVQAWTGATENGSRRVEREEDKSSLRGEEISE